MVADLSDYFGQIPHAELLKSVARRVSDGRMLGWVKAWLEMAVEEDDGKGGTRRTNRAGRPATPFATACASSTASPSGCLTSNLLKRRLRWHQSWYRDRVLGTEYGTGPNGKDTTLYGNMLTKETAESGLNFLTPRIFEAVKRRLAEPRDGETIEEFRLMRNMLSSQPMCFNLFGELSNDRDLATVLCRVLWGGHIARVTNVQFERAPLPREEYLNESKGTAFDAFIEYQTAMGDMGFVGIETKLTEPFSQNEYDRPEYRKWMTKDSPWRTDVDVQKLISSRNNQIWRDHLLSWALLSHPKSIYAIGNLTIIYHPLDDRCAETISDYRKLLRDKGMFSAFDLGKIVSVWKPLLARSVDLVTPGFVKNKERLRAAAHWLQDFEERYLMLDRSKAEEAGGPAQAVLLPAEHGRDGGGHRHRRDAAGRSPRGRAGCQD